MMEDGNVEGAEVRERYLRHFTDMAKRGFWSFDRDLQDENLYHLIARPAGDVKEENFIEDLPELCDGEFDKKITSKEMRDVGIVINRG